MTELKDTVSLFNDSSAPRRLTVTLNGYQMTYTVTSVDYSPSAQIIKFIDQTNDFSFIKLGCNDSFELRNLQNFQES